MPHYASMFQSHLTIAAISLVLVGCATKEKIPADHLNEYALLVPRQNNNSIVSEIDGRSPGLSFSGATVDMQPGRHTVQTFSCYGGTSSCKPDIYVFDAQAGFAYVFRSPTVVEVFDRFNIDKSKLGNLHETSNRVFVTDHEFAAVQNRILEQVANDGLAAMERRKRDLPAVRKIGARICQERERGVIYVGYVEGMTDEKIQIRVADARYIGVPGAHPTGFSPSIIWDSPMQWDLCE